ncbi:MAG: extracellular solute-binding protein [Clostridia bacterium]|nr:extracellular solute-binding protein [Clostridia bacterium]
MKATKRLTAMAMLPLLLLQSASCASADTGNTDGTDASTDAVTEAVTVDPKQAEKQAYFANLAPISAAGAEIAFAAINLGSEELGDNDIATAGENGAKMNDAVYARNREIEEKLGVKLVVNGFDSDSDLQSAVSNDTLSGEGFYDVVSAKTTSQAVFFNNGYLADISTIPNLQLEKEWWNKDANEAFTIAGLQFLLLSPLCHWADSVAWFVMFNKALFEEYDLEDPYQLVRDGKWTLDAMYEMMKVIPLDSNGNGQTDGDDMFGCVAQKFDALALTTAFGCNIFEKDANDIPQFVLPNEENLDKMQTISDFFADTARTIAVDHKMYSGVADRWNVLWANKFAEGKGLFMFNCPGNLSSFTDMEQDFGILPMPKYNEAQKNYRTMTSIWFTTSLSVPKVHGADNGDIGTVLDALSYLSYVDVEPTFAETYLQNRHIRDEESAEMLNIITASKSYDPGFVFNWSSAITLPQSALDNGGDKLASTMEKARKSIEKSVAQTVTAAQDLMNE